MAHQNQTYTLDILPHPHKPTQVPQVNKKDTPNALVFTTNASGYKVEDIQVQIEDNEALVLRFGQAARRFDLPPNACLEETEANWNAGILSITIPKTH
ncbi:hypothetical protein GOP47_0019594 [Adiantum capillus-veneris]|uniref:SHSP domain-containing protein n=1 Tax=Adiantum capillus-veneris TaxID=13818 RepID=A0A9D4Z7Y3_ADICA|nr:hypothetical protein GOP47_0019594 [Adiantum capillus-veneris]